MTGLPEHFPPGNVLMLTDSMPICGHDPVRVAAELAGAAERLACCAVVLDLQRPGVKEAAAVVRAAEKEMPCPLVVAAAYGKETSGAVLLPPPELWTPLAEHLASWKGRKIWLEAALEGAAVTVTEQGSRYESCPWEERPKGERDALLHISYRSQREDVCAKFHLRRGWEELDALLAEAKVLGVEGALGLYQQLGEKGNCFKKHETVPCTIRKC